MKCCIREYLFDKGDWGPWRQGYISSFGDSGDALLVSFVDNDGNGLLFRPSYRFGSGSRFDLHGFRNSGELNKYLGSTLEVSPGWGEPVDEPVEDDE